jgi:hypothetical protein
MKNQLRLLVFMILLMSQNLVCRDNLKSIFVCDSLSKPIANAYIEIIHLFWGTTVFHGITDDKGKIDIQIPEGRYEIIISHAKYNQYISNFYINDKNSLYKFPLSHCYDYCILEGRIQFSNTPKKGTLEDSYLKYSFVKLFNELYIDYEIDSTGYYEIKLPIGKYRISFNESLISKEVDFYENKLIIYNFQIYSLHNPGLIIDPPGFQIFDFRLYGNIYRGLEYYPGVIPIK